MRDFPPVFCCGPTLLPVQPPVEAGAYAAEVGWGGLERGAGRGGRGFPVIWLVPAADGVPKLLTST